MYTLEFEGPSAEDRGYVGHMSNYQLRLRDHIQGSGAAWTASAVTSLVDENVTAVRDFEGTKQDALVAELVTLELRKASSVASADGRVWRGAVGTDGRVWRGASGIDGRV